MPTIILQLNVNPKPSKVPAEKQKTQTTATVASSPGRYYYATVAGKARTFERVGVDASGNEIYRDQNRR